MNTSPFVAESEMVGDSDEDTRLLRSMATEARDYLREFKWCPPIKRMYLATGVGGVIALFLAELEEMIGKEDSFLWVVVGDLPSAYLVADLESPCEVIESYCQLMAEWAEAVRTGTPLDGIFPVAAQPTTENAELLLSRLNYLRENIIGTYAPEK